MSHGSVPVGVSSPNSARFHDAARKRGGNIGIKRIIHHMRRQHRADSVGGHVTERAQLNRVQTFARVMRHRHGMMRIGGGVPVSAEVFGRRHHADALHPANQRARQSTL